MREEQKKDTPLAEKLKSYTSKGEMVPLSVTLELLVKAMFNRKSDRYLLDGFPRTVEQAQIFEKNIKEADSILFYDVPDQVLIDRLTSRMKSTPVNKRRADDNEETFKKRVAIYNSTTKPIVDM